MHRNTEWSKQTPDPVLDTCWTEILESAWVASTPLDQHLEHVLDYMERAR